MENLNWQRTKIVRAAYERLNRFLSVTLYKILGWIHLALVTDAGLLIIVFAPSLFRAQPVPKPISYAFALGYVVCDLICLPILRGTTISMGFPLIFLTLLADSPFAALLIAILGSLVSETLRSRFIQHLPWFATLRRAFFYAGHHAVAGLGALIAYQLISGSPSWLQLEVIHIQAALAYVVVYSLVSMLLVWPHDRRIHLFLAPDEEPFVRVHILVSSLLLPIPASLFYIYNQVQEQAIKMLVVVGILPPIFVLLFFVARHFTRTEEERDRLALREEISQRLGSPANIPEVVQLLLTTMGNLVEYHWGAVYSLVDGELNLYGEKPHKGPVKIWSPSKAKETSIASGDTQTDENQVVWPAVVILDEGILVELAKQDSRPQFFDDGLTPATSSDPYLPRKTALAVFPVIAGSQEKGEAEPPRLLGLIALARPKRLFTTWDWEKGQALSSQTGNVLLNAQRLEKVLRELSQQMDDYARERVHQAMQELISQQVDVSRILAAVSEHAFQGNLRAVLRGMVEEKRGNKISLAPGTLTEIYNQVRDETPGTPPLTPHVLQMLQTVTSSLSLAFSFRYQFPDVVRGPAFKGFYQFLLDALDANTVSRIVVLDLKIESTVETFRKRERVRRETWGARTAKPTTLPSEAIEEVERLQDIIHPLKEYGEASDSTDQKASLGQALERLMEREGAVRERLRNPERFVFLQILSSWREVVINALEDLARGPARLKVGLRSNRALPLEEITVGLVLHNQGPGVASSAVIQLVPSEGYQVLEGKIDWGTLTAGKTIEPEFTLRSAGAGPLRLRFRITYHDPERKGKAEEFADLLYLREPPPRFTEIPNPYTPGLPLKPDNPTFVGREDIFNFIQRSIPALMRKTVLILTGERRTGKTSILKQLPVRLNDSRYIPVYIDGQALGIDPGMGSFFLSIATAIADGVEEAGISIPRLTLGELGESPQHVFAQRFLPVVREQIGERVLLLTMDEFEELGSRVKRGRLPYEIFPYLRHLIQHEEQLAFIFAGTHKIEELIGDYWSVLFNIAKYRRVGFLKRDYTIRLITELVQPHGMVYDDLAVDEALRVTACHPYLTQLLCSILVDRCNETECNYVTVQNVRDAVEELLETGRAHLVFLWQTSDWKAKLALATLAELRDRLDQVTAAAIADRLKSYQIDLAPGQIMEKMEQLVGRDIVHEIPGASVAYDFTAQLYAHWFRRYKSLSKVVEEVNNELGTE